MFDQLFVRSDALTRYLSAPLVAERRQYLTHCAVQGMTKSTLEAKARLLLYYPLSELFALSRPLTQNSSFPRPSLSQECPYVRYGNDCNEAESFAVRQ